MTDEPFSSAEDDSVIVKGPANWFTFRLGEGLNLRQNEAFLEMTPTSDNIDFAEGDAPAWTMSLYSVWVEDEEPQRAASSFSPESAFPEIVRSSETRPLELPGRSRAWTGISNRPTDVPLWKRFWKPRRAFEWRLWVVEYCEILVVASLQSTGRNVLSDHALRQCEKLLNSILFAEYLARPPALFREAVIEIARKKFPLLETKATGSFAIRIAESEVNLTNFYRSYLTAPQDLERIVLPGMTTMVRMQELSVDQLMPPLDEVEDSVMPMLYPVEGQEERLEDFVGQDWVGGLKIMYVLDEDESYRFVHRQLLDQWSITEDEIHELALRNLQSYAEDNPLEVSVVGEEDDARMLIPVNSNPYNSVRILGEGLHEQLRNVLGAELLVGIPNRDFFVAVSLQHPELIGQVKERVQQDYQSMHHPLTNRLLVISADGVSEYCD